MRSLQSNLGQQVSIDLQRKYLKTERSWDNIRFVALFIVLSFIYIEPNPTSASWTPGAAQSEVEGQLVQQLMWPFLFGISCIVVGNKWREVLNHFDLFTISVFAWILLTTFLAVNPGVSARRFFFMALVSWSVMVLIASIHEQAKILKCMVATFAVSTIYSISYIVFRPQYGLHTAVGPEPHLAGNWRGQFAHKNIAAGVASIELLFGSQILRFYGLYALFFLPIQMLFLYKTSGKTAAVLIVPVFILTYIVCQSKTVFAILAKIAIPLLVINLIAIGSLYNDTLHSVTSLFLGDGSFTGRDELWRLLVYYSSLFPFIGSGFQSFWQINYDSPAMLYGGTWTVDAFYGHQSYLDLMASIGVPGLILAICFVLVRPAIDLAAIRKRNSPMLKIYIAMWLFPLFQGTTESVIFVKADPSWVALLIGITGIRRMRIEQ